MVAVAQLKKETTERMVVDLNAASVFKNLGTRVDDDLDGAYQTTLDRINFNAVAGSLGGAGEDVTWPTAGQLAATGVTIALDDHKAVRNVLSEFTRRRMRSGDPTAATRQKQSAVIGNAVDAAIATYFIGRTVVARGSALTADNVRGGTFGTASSAFIAPSGTPNGATQAAQQASRKAIFDAFEDFMLQAGTSGAEGPQSESPIGGDVGDKWCVTRPEIFRNLMQYLRIADLGGFVTKDELLLQGTFGQAMANAGPMQLSMARRAWMGRLEGVDFFNSLNLPKATGSIAWSMVFGWRAGWAYGEDDLMVDIDMSHGAGPKTYQAAVTWFGEAILNGELVYVATIRQK